MSRRKGAPPARPNGAAAAANGAAAAASAPAAGPVPVVAPFPAAVPFPAAPPTDQGIPKAALVLLERGSAAKPLRSIEAAWNPSSYRIRKASARSAPAAFGPPRRSEEFSTELFVDTGGETGAKRDARRILEELRSWMDPVAGGLLPSKVLFVWGTFRFAGRIEEILEEWIRFDPDGTPIRGRIRLLLRD